MLPLQLQLFELKFFLLLCLGGFLLAFLSTLEHSVKTLHSGWSRHLQPRWREESIGGRTDTGISPHEDLIFRLPPRVAFDAAEQQQQRNEDGRRRAFWSRSVDTVSTDLDQW